MDDILMWCGQDIKGAIEMIEDHEVCRRFVDIAPIYLFIYNDIVHKVAYIEQTSK